MKRRNLIKYLSVAPLAGLASPEGFAKATGIFGAGVPVQTAIAAPLHTGVAKAKRDVIKELGLRTFINAAGTYTTHTASLMHDEVMETINVAAKEFIMIEEVQDKVGEKIAALCHAEAAMVTAGCWSAMVLGTAGVLTGMDPKRVAQLPNLDGFIKTEMIVQKTHNTGYVHAPKNTGIQVVEVETVEQLEKAITEKTAMMWFLNLAAPKGLIQHQEWVAIAKKHNIPAMIDMAADVPPVENLWKYNDMGFDLVCISGGKAMCGPQSAGILMGKKDLIAAARLSAPPRGGNIGRGMKVNKEEILGMYVAVEKYINTDHVKEWKMWEEQIGVIESAAKKVDGVITEISVPPVANHTPLLRITWDNNKIKTTSRELREKLRFGAPSVEVMGDDTGINITVFMLKPGQEKIVAARVQEEFRKVQAG